MGVSWHYDFWMTLIVNEHSKPSLLDQLKVIYPGAFDNLR
jgi:hypothetical protein